MLNRFWHWFSTKRAGWRVPAYKATYVSDPPDTAKRNQLFVVGTRTDPFQVVMGCPCGCRRPIYLDLVPSHGAQHWKLEVSPSALPTLSPSVWRVDGCRSHFLLKAGRVVWC
jgi:hypothetical protein